MSQAPTKSVCFTGTWELRTTDNLDAYLESEGIGWFKRKAAKALSAQNYIEHNVEKNHFHVKLVNPRGTTQYEFVADGKEFKYVDSDKNETTGKAVWNDDKTHLIENASYNNGKKHRVMERWFKDGEMLLKLTNEKGKSMTRYFKKTKDVSGL